MKDPKFFTHSFQVPCARAKPKKDGKYGYHTVTVTLKDWIGPTGHKHTALQNITCDCEKTATHEDLEFFVDFSSGKVNVCYYYPMLLKNKFKYGLKFDTDWSSPDKKILEKRFPYIHAHIGQVMYYAAEATSSRKLTHKAVGPIHINPYTKLVRELTGNESHFITLKDNKPSHYAYNGVLLATMNEHGSWVLFEGFALSEGLITSKTYSCNGLYETTLLSGDRIGIKEPRVCPVCWQSYERYQDHTSSLGHKKNVTEIILQALKITSKKGLAKYQKDGMKAFYSKRQLKAGRFGDISKRANIPHVQKLQKEFFELGMEKSYVTTLAQKTDYPIAFLEAALEERRKKLFDGKK